jgi:2-hydroxychromene-2-carboxylate isomerase
MTTHDWYFDFISPYAYLQWRRLHRDRPDLRLNPKPVLLAGLLKHWGQLGPAELPEKRRQTYRLVLWQARQLGIPLRFPPAHPFNPLPALRLCLAADDIVAATDRIFDHVWRQGRAADPESLAPLAKELGVESIDDEVKRRLAANGEEAIALGLFGVPTLRIGERLFWGNDATDMALQYLADPASVDDADMRRLDALPIGVQRPGAKA